MTFECNQAWDQMPLGASGRRCDICQKTVHDFSNKALADIPNSNDELCGMFLAEQVEQDLIPMEIPFSLKTTLLTIGTVVGLDLVQVHAQGPPKQDSIEIVENISAAAPVTTTLQPPAEAQVDKINSPECKTDFKRRKKFYFSRSFPFIKKARVVRMGRYRR